MDRRRLGSADDIKRNGLRRGAAEAPDLKIPVPGMEGIANGEGRPSNPLRGTVLTLPLARSRGWPV